MTGEQERFSRTPLRKPPSRWQRFKVHALEWATVLGAGSLGIGGVGCILFIMALPGLALLTGAVALAWMALHFAGVL